MNPETRMRVAVQSQHSSAVSVTSVTWKVFLFGSGDCAFTKNGSMSNSKTITAQVFNWLFLPKSSGRLLSSQRYPCRSCPTRRSNPTAMIEGCPALNVTSAYVLASGCESCVATTDGLRRTWRCTWAWTEASCQTWSVESENLACER